MTDGSVLGIVTPWGGDPKGLRFMRLDGNGVNRATHKI